MVGPSVGLYELFFGLQGATHAVYTRGEECRLMSSYQIPGLGNIMNLVEKLICKV